MNKEENLVIQDFFLKNEENIKINQEIYRIIESNFESLNSLLSIYQSNGIYKFPWIPSLSIKQEYIDYNFWYFYIYLVLSFKDGNIIDFHSLNIEDTIKNSFSKNYYLENKSLIEFIGDFIINYSKNKNFKTNFAKNLILDKNYIPLICIQFICHKTCINYLTLDQFISWLKREYHDFCNMISNYCSNKCISKINILKNLSLIEKEFDKLS